MRWVKLEDTLGPINNRVKLALVFSGSDPLIGPVSFLEFMEFFSTVKSLNALLYLSIYKLKKRKKKKGWKGRNSRNMTFFIVREQNVISCLKTLWEILIGSSRKQIRPVNWQPPLLLGDVWSMKTKGDIRTINSRGLVIDNPVSWWKL